MMTKNKSLSLDFSEYKDTENQVVVKNNRLPEVTITKKGSKKEKLTPEDITKVSLDCIREIHFMLDTRVVSKKFSKIYVPVNPGIEGSTYKFLIVNNKEEFLEYLVHALSLLKLNSELYIPAEEIKTISERMYYIILTYSEGKTDTMKLFDDLPKWDATHKWCENGYFDENWNFHKAPIPRGVVKQLGIYIPDNWDTLIQDEGQGFQYITQFFRQLAWTKEDYDIITSKINEFLKTEPTKKALLGSSTNGKYKGGFIYNLLTHHSNVLGERALAYMMLYCLEINTINEKILFLQSKGGGGKDSLIDPLVKLLGGIENNVQLSINELNADFLPSAVNRSNLIYNMEAKATDIQRASRKLNQLSGNSPFEVNSKNKEPVSYVNFTQKVLFGLNDPIYTLGSSDGSLNRRVVQYRSYWYTSDDGVNPWRNYYVCGDPENNLIVYDINKTQIANLPSYNWFPLLLLRYLIQKWDSKITYEEVFKNYSLKGQSNSDILIDIADSTYSRVDSTDDLSINLTDFIQRNMGLHWSDQYVICANNDRKYKIMNNCPIDTTLLLNKYNLGNTKFYVPLSTVAKLSKDILRREISPKVLQEELVFNNYKLTKYNGGTKALEAGLNVIEGQVILTFIKTGSE